MIDDVKLNVDVSLLERYAAEIDEISNELKLLDSELKHITRDEAYELTLMAEWNDVADNDGKITITIDGKEYGYPNDIQTVRQLSENDRYRVSKALMTIFGAMNAVTRHIRELYHEHRERTCILLSNLLVPAKRQYEKQLCDIIGAPLRQATNRETGEIVNLLIQMGWLDVKKFRRIPGNLIEILNQSFGTKIEKKRRQGISRYIYKAGWGETDQMNCDILTYRSELEHRYNILSQKLRRF